jgi:hypothetical protein
MLGVRQNDPPGRQKGARVGQPPGRIDQLSGRAIRTRAVSTWRIWEALRRNRAPLSAKCCKSDTIGPEVRRMRRTWLADRVKATWWTCVPGYKR